jgi:hypothetical protein
MVSINCKNLNEIDTAVLEITDNLFLCYFSSWKFIYIYYQNFSIDFRHSHPSQMQLYLQ